MRFVFILSRHLFDFNEIWYGKEKSIGPGGYPGSSFDTRNGPAARDDASACDNTSACDDAADEPGHTDSGKCLPTVDGVWATSHASTDATESDVCDDADDASDDGKHGSYAWWFHGPFGSSIRRRYTGP